MKFSDLYIMFDFQYTDIDVGMYEIALKERGAKINKKLYGSLEKSVKGHIISEAYKIFHFFPEVNMEEKDECIFFNVFPNEFSSAWEAYCNFLNGIDYVP
jgi:hypothetical protein